MTLRARLAAFVLPVLALGGCAAPSGDDDRAEEASGAFSVFAPPFDEGLYVTRGDGEGFSLELRDETSISIRMHYRDTGTSVSICEARISRLVGTPRDGTWPFRSRGCNGDIRRGSGDDLELDWTGGGSVRYARTFARKR